MRLPLRPPTTPTREGRLFADLCRAILKPKAREARKNACILAYTWSIVDKRVSARQDPARYQAHIWRLGRAINASFREDSRQWTEEAGAEIERLLGVDPPLHKEVWQRMKGWYRYEVNCVPPSIGLPSSR